MSLIQEFSPLLCLEEIRGKTRAFSDSFLQSLSQSIATTSCGADTAESESFRDDSTAFILKMVAIVSILVAGVTGVSIPLVGKRYQFLRTDSNLFFVAKGFAAGVILATGFVHMLPDAMSDLTNSCLPTIPWSKFPFSGFIAMMAALATLLVDFVGTQYYERKQSRPILSVDNVFDSVVVPVVEVKDRMHAHTAHHRHEHSHGVDEEGGGRHAVISQVLELGIVSHSVIIGLTLGVSQTPSAIKPLIGALSFHQFFEGFALGGCISQAQFNTLHSTFMSCFFAVTTPLGIAVGAGISSFYDGNSPRGLVIEGVLDSISAGILVYMALVDLIAADFLTKRMSCNVKLQIVSYFLLFLGAALMSSLAVWA